MSFGSTWDWIRHLANPIPRHLAAMGYARGLRQLDSRGRRCRLAWRPHVERSRALMLEAADRCARNRKAVVIGSGPLFDIPVAELSRRFREVVLVDILHLRQVRSAVRRYPNVRLRCADVTGVVEEVHAMAQRGRRLALPERKPDFFPGEDADLVVSANILSQLPLAPVRYATRKKNGPAPWWVKAFSRRLVVDHLDWLASLAGNVCLISDLERLYCDGEDVVCRDGSLRGVDLPEGGRRWLWDLAPKPELDPRYDVRHVVAGYAQFPKRVWLERKRPGNTRDDLELSDGTKRPVFEQARHKDQTPP